MLKNIIFDLDGTLADTAPDILFCLRLAFSKSGVKPKRRLDKFLIGPPIWEIVKKVQPKVSERQLNDIVVNFRFCYDNSIYPRSVLMLGANQVLSVLRRKKCKIFVLTNKPKLATNKILTKLKIGRYVKFAISPDTISSKKRMGKREMLAYLLSRYRLKASQTLLVGDGESDIIAAKSLHVSCAAVISGYTKKQELTKLHPEYQIKKIKDILKLVD